MLISPAEWQTLQERTTLSTFRPAIERLRAEVADFLARLVAVQAQPGGYYHDYFCPQHGVQLVFDPASPRAHRCPVDNALVIGDPFDAAWRWFVNNRLAEGSIRLALLWRLEGNPDHLNTLIKILQDYADHYPAYQRMPTTVANPGVATYTTLDESVWVLPLVWAFDLIREALSLQQIEHIGAQLLAPVAAHLVEHHFSGVHNFACWHNAAIGAIGVVLKRSDLVDFAIKGKFGFETQVREGVLADGLWFEGSFSYHFYALAALLHLVKATRHLPGLDLGSHPAIRAMFLAPIQSVYPDWSLPATNDCWYFTSLVADCCHGVPPAPAFYEIGFAWYGDPLFAQALQRAYAQSPRDSLDAFLFGTPSLPVVSQEPLPSTHLPTSGYAILRSEAQRDDAQRYLLLKYGPHGGGHGHPDKLNLILYANGQRLSADLGAPGYGFDLFEGWYRQTISHNSITIDGLSQSPSTGQIHTYRGDGPLQIADASVNWPSDEVVEPAVYRGVYMRRLLLARPDYFLDLVWVESPEPRQIDWIYHSNGVLATTLHGQTSISTQGQGEGYQHIVNTCCAPMDDDFTTSWQVERGGVQLFVASTGHGVAIIGQAPGHPPTELRTVLIQRRQAPRATFLSLFHPYQAGPTITTVEWLSRDLLAAGWAGCIVHTQGRREGWVIRLTENNTLPIIPSADVWFNYALG